MSMLRHFDDGRVDAPVSWRDSMLTFNAACFSCHVSQAESNYDPETGALSFPESLDSLEGQKIVIAGFMAPYDFLDDMSTFMLMPSYVGRHFCKPPAPSSARQEPVP